MRDFSNKKRIVVKIGSSSLFHVETGKHDFMKIERLVRILSDLQNQGKDVILVSSGAISTGRNMLSLSPEGMSKATRQACASVGQAQLISIYQKLFAEYSTVASQILITRYTVHNTHTRTNTANTLEALLNLGVLPIINENDTVTTEELEFGDNDCLSALVGKLVGADLLILLSDIDGLFEEDPKVNPNAKLISTVEEIDEQILSMGKRTPGTQYGSGGMSSKLEAAQIATGSGIDMVIVNSDNLDHLEDVLQGKEVGTLFKASKEETYFFEEYEITD